MKHLSKDQIQLNKLNRELKELREFNKLLKKEEKGWKEYHKEEGRVENIFYFFIGIFWSFILNLLANILHDELRQNSGYIVSTIALSILVSILLVKYFFLGEITPTFKKIRELSRIRLDIEDYAKKLKIDVKKRYK